ncbi:MAG: hypothetical protein IJU95_10360 [Treponema sp.]|nr:hypothetical protein [Treponema sp.]
MSDMIDEEAEGNPAEMLLAYKKQLIQFGIFTGFLVVLFALTALFSVLSANHYRQGLRDVLADTLKSRGYEDIELDELYEIKNPFAVSAQVCTVSGSGYSHAVIIRITTMVGPVPAVFLYDSSSNKADFICYLTLGSRVERMLLDSTKHSLLEYWALRLPAIISAPFEEVQ